jgi:hypothetical protein
MKTRQDLIAKALELLNAYGAGQSPEPEDVVVIDNNMDGLLLEAGINVGNYFNADDGLPDEYLAPLAIIVANENAPAFGQPQNAESKASAIARLRSMKPSSYAGSTLSVDYF